MILSADEGRNARVAPVCPRTVTVMTRPPTQTHCVPAVVSVSCVDVWLETVSVIIPSPILTASVSPGKRVRPVSVNLLYNQAVTVILNRLILTPYVLSMKDVFLAVSVSSVLSPPVIS